MNVGRKPVRSYEFLPLISQFLKNFYGVLKGLACQWDSRVSRSLLERPTPAPFEELAFSGGFRVGSRRDSLTIPCPGLADGQPVSPTTSGPVRLPNRTIRSPINLTRFLHTAASRGLPRCYRCEGAIRRPTRQRRVGVITRSRARRRRPHASPNGSASDCNPDAVPRVPFGGFAVSRARTSRRLSSRQRRRQCRT